LSKCLGVGTSTPGSIASARRDRPLVRGLIGATALLASLGMLLGQGGAPLKRPRGSLQSRRQLPGALDRLAV
jgi:hypothetical protein